MPDLPRSGLRRICRRKRDIHFAGLRARLVKPKPLPDLVTLGPYLGALLAR
jgi:hypothetical protein